MSEGIGERVGSAARLYSKAFRGLMDVCGHADAVEE